MHPKIVAGILERAVNSSIGAEACVTAQGSPALQDELTFLARRALTTRGVLAEHPVPDELLAVAADLRATSPAPTPDPTAIAAVLTEAATWIETHGYGPAELLPRHDPQGAPNFAILLQDIVHAVTRVTGTDLPLRFDALTVIAQHLPVCGVTITDWEYNHNPRGADGALALLRGLAATAPLPSYTPLPTEPRPDRNPLRLDLTDLAPLATAVRTSTPATARTADERRDLTRIWQGVAAHAADTDPELASDCQARADILRAESA
ncbi:hypothetical protein [Kitasatospora phosalacinea]|uniref:Uncharacterized protein n=1 Tax=Kitasatospora phosalacinea TaxID=2065 RepID=A0A9W6URA9_9ACTN|nr:hypothetical protein [Kitasatospora phosalacinea]GLW58109.1 hypothetical protein Kpho01_61200 [Kitasatospora phosalacinea]